MIVCLCLYYTLFAFSNFVLLKNDIIKTMKHAPELITQSRSTEPKGHKEKMISLLAVINHRGSVRCCLSPRAGSEVYCVFSVVPVSQIISFSDQMLRLYLHFSSVSDFDLNITKVMFIL